MAIQDDEKYGVLTRLITLVKDSIGKLTDNVEVILARGVFEFLHDRLDDVDTKMSDNVVNLIAFPSMTTEADDTARINRAIAYCKAHGLSINFGNHTYTVADTIIFDGFTGNIYGNNTNINSTADTKDIVAVYNSDNILISGLNLSNVHKVNPKDYYGANVKGLYIATSDNVEVNRVNVQWATDGISANTCENIEIHNCVCHDLGEEIIVVNNCRHPKIHDNEGYNHCGDGILLKSSKDYTESIFNVHHNYIHDGSARDAVPPNAAGKGGGITHNGEGQTGVGAIFNIHDNTIVNTEYGITIGNCQKAHVTHNNIKTTTGVGISVLCDSTYNIVGAVISDILVDGNILDANSGIAIQVNPYGTFTAIPNTVISKNIIKNCYGTYVILAKDSLVLGNIIPSGYGTVSINGGSFNDNEVTNTHGRFLFTNCNVCGNIITGNTGTDQYCITASDCNISNNTFANNYMMGYYTACRLIGNKFYKSTAIASYILPSSPGNYYGQATLFLLDTVLMVGNVITDDYGIICVRNSVSGRGTIASNFITINNGNINIFVGIITAKLKIFNNTFNKKIVIDNTDSTYVVSDDTLTTHATFVP